MNDETRARESAGQPRICVNEGVVYMAPWGYEPLGLNAMGEMIGSNGSDIYVFPRLGRQVAQEE